MTYELKSILRNTPRVGETLVVFETDGPEQITNVLLRDDSEVTDETTNNEIETKAREQLPA